jgi:hypothetical protein
VPTLDHLIKLAEIAGARVSSSSQGKGRDEGAQSSIGSLAYLTSSRVMPK